jgi:WhiB family transcriptional regulator, redox-sensing transcriptional regulator
MAAPAEPEPPTGVSLIELAIGAGYAFRDQLWRTRAACAGVDPEVFLTDRGASPEPALAYCRRCEVRTECLQAALDLGQQAVGVWGGVSAKQRRFARGRGWDAERLLAELDAQASRGT